MNYIIFKKQESKTQFFGIDSKEKSVNFNTTEVGYKDPAVVQYTWRTKASAVTYSI
jgi:hypothetical protein